MLELKQVTRPMATSFEPMCSFRMGLLLKPLHDFSQIAFHYFLDVRKLLAKPMVGNSVLGKIISSYFFRPLAGTNLLSP